MVGCTSTFPYEKPYGHVEIITEMRLAPSWTLLGWSPDSSRLLLSRPTPVQDKIEDGPLAIVEVEDGSMYELSKSGISATWSPDSGALIIQTIGDNQKDQFWLYLIKDDRSFSLNGISGRLVSWLSDGSLVYQSNNGLWSVKLDLPETGSSSEELSVTEQVSLLAYDFSDYRRWAYPSPTLESIVLYDGTNDLRSWWVVQRDGERINLGKPFYSIGTCCAWARDGDRFAFFSYEPELALYLVDRNGQNFKQLITAKDVGDGAFISMDFSPDNQTIAFEWSTQGEGFPFENTQIYLINIDGSGLRNLTPDSAPHHYLQWSPDGTYIAFYGMQNEIWVAQLEMVNNQ